MADGFQKRTFANRINFGMRHTKWLIAMMHWVQDFSRCSRQPTIDDFVMANDFKQALSTAAQHASLRKVDTDQVDTISKAADLGKLKDERKWPEWYPDFVNYLSTIPGVYGVPLSYIVRENKAPDHARDFAGDFTEEITACAPLVGPKFRADARKVHQLVKNFSRLNRQSSGSDRWHHEATAEMMFSSCVATMRVKATRVEELPLPTSIAKLYITKANLRCPGNPSSIGCRRCSTSTRKRAKK